MNKLIPGDLVVIPPSSSDRNKETIGIIVSTRGSKWDSTVRFRTVLTPYGLEEILQYKKKWILVQRIQDG